MKKVQLRKIVKAIEFVFIAAFAVVMYVFNFKFGWVAALILVGGYVALNLFGWANRPLYEARDEIKDVFEK